MTSKLLDLNTHLRLANTEDHLRHLIIEISRASKYINHAIQTGELGLAGTSNLYGEMQLELDVLSDKIITDALFQSGLVSCLSSEEKGEALECVSQFGEYVVVFDPLDGSSLVDTNLSVGSVFGIYPKGDLIGRKGNEMVAALYILYGPRTTLIYTTGNGSHEFTLNDVGEYNLSKENIKIRDEAKRFAPGNLRVIGEVPEYEKAVNHFMRGGLTLRYSGGMVPDINTTLMKGDGIFMYPGSPKEPNGKLRLLFECAPMAMIMTAAGGIATDGQVDILDKTIEALDQRTAIFIGSKESVREAIGFYGV